jgi:hypothetical protein
MYNRPIVENNLIEPSDFSALNPIKPKACGPINKPDIIKPIIPGIRNFRKTIGERRIINNNNEKTNTGLVSGN